MLLCFRRLDDLAWVLSLYLFPFLALFISFFSKGGGEGFNRPYSNKSTSYIGFFFCTPLGQLSEGVSEHCICFILKCRNSPLAKNFGKPCRLRPVRQCISTIRGSWLYQSTSSAPIPRYVIPWGPPANRVRLETRRLIVNGAKLRGRGWYRRSSGLDWNCRKGNDDEELPWCRCCWNWWFTKARLG